MSSEKGRGSLRWKAIEAFNGARFLTPAARRVGIALVCAMDGRTGNCFPSEGRLAVMLGMSARAVRLAKIELRDGGLIDWQNHGRPKSGVRNLSHYILAWDRLVVIADDIAARARDHVASGGEPEPASAHANPEPQFRFSDTPNPESGFRSSNPEPGFRIGRSDTSKPETPCIKTGSSARQNRNHSSGEHRSKNKGAGTAQPFVGNSASAEQDGDASAAPLAGASSSPSPLPQATHADARSAAQVDTTRPQGPDLVERPMSLEEIEPKRGAPRPKLKHWPALLLAFETDPQIVSYLDTSPATVQQDAAKLLATKGADAVRAWLGMTKGAA